MKHILVIASRDDVGPLIQKTLESEGFKANVLESFGRLDEVYEELDQQNYDVLLATNNGLTPDEILRLVPEVRRRFPALRIVVSSGYRTQEFERELQQCGADAFFPLPFEFKQLIAKMG